MNVSDFTKCSGCTSCASICPKHAIEMKENSKGFLRPFINKELCVDCGLCFKACDFNGENVDSNRPLSYVGMKNKDLEKRQKSASGGIFYALAEKIIEGNGTVYGATLIDNKIVKHIRATNIDELNALRKSKYAASDMRNIFIEIKKDLANKKVLFSGTPCQVAGLLSFLKYSNVDTSNLYTIDLICHGTPSNKIWKEYVEYIENREHEKVKVAIFRDKTYGWKTHYESFEFANKKIKTDKFRELFYSNLILPDDGCFVCKYESLDRRSDITIGDLLGTQKEAESFKDKFGVSLVMPLTQKGLKLLSLVKDDFDEISLKEEEIMQPNLKAPVKKPLKYEKFWKDYENKSFDKVLKKWPESAMHKRIREFKERVQNKLKRVMHK